MKEIPKFEDENSEISEKDLVAALKKGAEDFDSRKLFEDWTRQEEAKVKEPIDAIQFNRKRGRVYAQAGYMDEAVESLEDALDQAFYEGRDDMVIEIGTEIDHIVGR